MQFIRFLHGVVTFGVHRRGRSRKCFVGGARFHRRRVDQSESSIGRAIWVGDISWSIGSGSRTVSLEHCRCDRLIAIPSPWSRFHAWHPWLRPMPPRLVQVGRYSVRIGGDGIVPLLARSVPLDEQVLGQALDLARLDGDSSSVPSSWSVTAVPERRDAVVQHPWPRLVGLRCGRVDVVGKVIEQHEPGGLRSRSPSMIRFSRFMLA